MQINDARTRMSNRLLTTRLSGEDLSFWWLDSPMQPTTMAMLMLLDGSPEPRVLRRAFSRTLAVVPKLRERVADAPLGLTLPHWEPDPTFDLDFHLRHIRCIRHGEGDLAAKGSATLLHLREEAVFPRRPIDRNLLVEGG